jgi:hypothetical protein
MTYPPLPGRRPARFPFRRCPLAWSAAIVLTAASLSWAGNAAWGAIQTWGTPVCSWPLKVQGAPNAAQAGLARCYLRDLAQGDTAGLQATAADIPAVRITQADLKYQADARAGLATAVITPSPVDTTVASMSITFADGAHEEAGMENMIAMGGPNGWRMCIGTDVTPDSGPPPVVMSPPPSSRR